MRSDSDLGGRADVDDLPREVEITERDEAAHSAVMKARAKESRGQGTADADVTVVLSGR